MFRSIREIGRKVIAIKMDCVQEEEDQADESFWWDSFWNQMLHDVPEEEMEEQELRGE